MNPSKAKVTLESSLSAGIIKYFATDFAFPISPSPSIDKTLPTDSGRVGSNLMDYNRLVA